ATTSPASASARRESGAAAWTGRARPARTSSAAAIAAERDGSGGDGGAMTPQSPPPAAQASWPPRRNSLPERRNSKEDAEARTPNSTKRIARKRDILGKMNDRVSLVDRIQRDLTAAMKARDADRTS